MNKPCSERAWGPPSSAPSPSNKSDLGVRLVAASFCAPCPDPGITTLTRMGPTPHKAPQPLACQAGLLDHTGCPGPVVYSHASLPFRGHGERTGGNSSSRLACSPCRQRFLQCPTAPLAARQGPLVLLKGQEPVWALERALWGAHSSGGCSQ